MSKQPLEEVIVNTLNVKPSPNMDRSEWLFKLAVVASGVSDEVWDSLPREAQAFITQNIDRSNTGQPLVDFDDDQRMVFHTNGQGAHGEVSDAENLCDADNEEERPKKSKREKKTKSAAAGRSRVSGGNAGKKSDDAGSDKKVFLRSLSKLEKKRSAEAPRKSGNVRWINVCSALLEHPDYSPEQVRDLLHDRGVEISLHTCVIFCGQFRSTLDVLRQHGVKV